MTGTLAPNRDNSINFDSASNLFIEGDNLEVLRILTTSLRGRVKCIYIDPPYNLNGDFVYNDDYRSGIDSYLRLSGQIRDGVRLSSNQETDGRYHSKWLTMMYPRLTIARHLLADDGAIFVSINDREAAHLRMLMDDIFDSDNFIAQVVWQRTEGARNDSKGLSVEHEYILVYARDAAMWRPVLLPRTTEQLTAFKNPDDDPRGVWRPADIAAKDESVSGSYPITCPGGRVIAGPPAGRHWAYSRQNFEALVADGRIYFGKDGNAYPMRKAYLTEVQQGVVPKTIWKYEDVGHTHRARKELLQRVPSLADEHFQTPKPTRLIRRILQIATNPEGGDIVLDFFAGTGTTGDAVMQQNAEDGGDRRFVLVQLPEPCPQTGYATITDICYVRLKAASEAVQTGRGLLAGDRPERFGFKTFRLDQSNFKRWQPIPPDENAGLTLLDAMKDYRTQTANSADDSMITEILLREGINPTVNWVESRTAGRRCILAQDGDRRLVTCLARDVTPAAAEEIASMQPVPTEVVMLEDQFAGKDALKSNVYKVFKDRGIIFRTV
jgi:adenine-specific DNA-methyltransferase